MVELMRLQTKDEYYATIAAIREQVKKLDNTPIKSVTQAKEIAAQMASLSRTADAMERDVYVDQTVKANWQEADRQRQQERDMKRYEAVKSLDRQLNPTRHVDPNILQSHLRESVDLLSGLSHPEKQDLIAQLVSGGGAIGADGLPYIPYGNARATLHTEEDGSQYVSFVGKDAGGDESQ